MRLIKVNKPAYRVSYDIKEKGRPTIESIVKEFLRTSGPTR
jgi:predicted GTPase